jgi:hypothetical protein
LHKESEGPPPWIDPDKPSLAVLANGGLREHSTAKRRTAQMLGFAVLINSSQMVFSINVRNNEFREERKEISC